jgi:hypothetical protein
MHMDGVNGVTQCPIAPDDYFVYNFNVTQYGSSWYHSHYSVQYADGAAGPITFHGPSIGAFDEAISPPLIMTDWGHNSAFDAVTRPFREALDDRDILLNGRGNVTKYNNTITSSTEVKPPYNITFEGPRKGLPNHRYLIRIINTSFQTTFIFSIDNHLLHVVEADFVPITGYTTNSILVGIGQRYNVIVEANPLTDPDNPVPLPKDNNYWIRTFVIPDCFSDMLPGTPGYEETGILRYNSSSMADPKSTQWKNISLECSDEAYNNLHPVLPWIVGDPSNNPPVGENFNVSLRQAGNYPLAFWNLGTKDSPGTPPIRVDYSNITFFNLDNKGPWNSSWRIQSEDYTSTSWVS